MSTCEVFLSEAAVNVHIEGVANSESYCGIGPRCVFMSVHAFKIRPLTTILGDFCYIEISSNDPWNGVKQMM